jgi:4-hydroxy-tetrahydrodipicolinate synthase
MIVAFVKELATIAGIDAVLAVVPYYNKPNQEGMYQHFKTIAEDVYHSYLHHK